uniref:uncharacterized protein LOC122601187 n=1 Tax=Erigeron canadensis TaxID=72917 RepID=UPI001CB959A4|nr:uncharacterized protein LOC122601187 [Erigeron canadensis]
MNQPPKQKEVRQVVSENQLAVCAILESHIKPVYVEKLCSKVLWNWNWMTNGNLCNKGSRIMLGWNTDLANVMLLSQSDQVIQTQIFLKADKRVVMCSFIYAHNVYTQRRALWNDLARHKVFIGDNPWCLLGDFNEALNLEDKASGPFNIDISMREFKECVDNIQVMDVNKVGLHYTWTQKPRGVNGVLKKIDRIMANLVFNHVFVGTTAVFQPYHNSDHFPVVLKIPMQSRFKPKPFKFSNVLVKNPKFHDIVLDTWSMDIVGVPMYRVVKKLKALKKPFQKLLFDGGNIHNLVSLLPVDLDEAQKALDKDPFNTILREKEASFLQAFNEALLNEERFLKQKAKIEWLKVGDSNSA